jgi:hypothetical protein
MFDVPCPTALARRLMDTMVRVADDANIGKRVFPREEIVERATRITRQRPISDPGK